MNKYKMIAMCSISIVFVLLLSMILPISTIANDKESLQLKWHYEGSTVTTTIIVNSDIYTGVVCKYLEIDNVLLSDDLTEQTKQEGKTVNVNQYEKDHYTATIDNISKRYVVVYVSIGNCELCDYIDCQPNEDEEKNEQPAENNAEQPTENNAEQPAENNVEQPAENNVEQPAQNNAEQPAGNNVISQSEKEQANQLMNELNAMIEKENASKTNTANSSNSKTTSSEQVVNRDEFQEIQSIEKISAAKSAMPQTGENDSAKITGIIIFSLIATFSFYKYKKAK